MKQIFWRFCGVLLYLATAALLSAAVMYLWNILLPGIAGLPVINYWQALGLLILARILFGGLGVHGGIGRGRGFGFIGQRNSLHEKWRDMTEEERNAFVKRHGGDIQHGRFHRPYMENGGKESETEKK